MDKIILECQKCGGSLTITNDVDLFKCQYCGMPYIVKREDGVTRIVRLEERVGRIGETVKVITELEKLKDMQKKVEKEAKKTNPLTSILWLVVLMVLCSSVAFIFAGIQGKSMEEFLPFIFCIGMALIIFLIYTPIWYIQKINREGKLKMQQEALQKKIDEAQNF